MNGLGVCRGLLTFVFRNKGLWIDASGSTRVWRSLEKLSSCGDDSILESILLDDQTICFSLPLLRYWGSRIVRHFLCHWRQGGSTIHDSRASLSPGDSLSSIDLKMYSWYIDLDVDEISIECLYSTLINRRISCEWMQRGIESICRGKSLSWSDENHRSLLYFLICLFVCLFVYKTKQEWNAIHTILKIMDCRIMQKNGSFTCLVLSIEVNTLSSNRSSSFKEEITFRAETLAINISIAEQSKNGNVGAHCLNVSTNFRRSVLKLLLHNIKHN